MAAISAYFTPGFPKNVPYSEYSKADMHSWKEWPDLRTALMLRVQHATLLPAGHTLLKTGRIGEKLLQTPTYLSMLQHRFVGTYYPIDRMLGISDTDKNTHSPGLEKGSS